MHLGINTLALEIAGQRLLVDPLLVGNLVPWRLNFVGENIWKNWWESVGKIFQGLVTYSEIDILPLQLPSPPLGKK